MAVSHANYINRTCINSTSPPQTITCCNTGDLAVSFSSIVASGDFAQTKH